MNKKLRPLGQVTDALEPILQEMLYDHQMQAHEVLGLIYLYIQVHSPDSIERYWFPLRSPLCSSQASEIGPIQAVLK